MQADAIVDEVGDVGQEHQLVGTGKVRPLSLPSGGSTAQVNFVKRGIEREDVPICTSNFSPEREQQYKDQEVNEDVGEADFDE